MKPRELSVNTWRRLWTGARRLLVRRHAPAPFGQFPLELSLVVAPGPPSTIGDVRAGRIPVRALAPLHMKANARAPWVFLAWMSFGIEASMTCLKMTEEGDPLPPLMGMAAAFLALALVATWPWLRVQRDIHKRRLRIAEGELTEKWTHDTHVNGAAWARLRQHQGFWRAVWASVRQGDVEPQPDQHQERRWVRIAGRCHEIEDGPLFDMLGSGVRYRVYLSAHAGQLIAIESLEREPGPEGYRDAPRRHAAGS